MTISPLQLRGLNRLGDVYMPGYESLPSFSRSGCARELPRVLPHMGAGDLADLKLLLTLMGLLPSPLVRLFVAFIEWSVRWPDWVGGIFRFVRLGVRGLIFTLYYSDPATLQTIGYDVKVYTGDQKQK
jgi:hypothetical protein